MIQDDVDKILNHTPYKEIVSKIYALYEAHFNERLALIADKYVVECPECRGIGGWQGTMKNGSEWRECPECKGKVTSDARPEDIGNKSLKLKEGG